MFTNTDSLCVEIQSEDVYKDLVNNDKFDFSDYPKDHFCYSNNNKKIVGKLKDELNGKIITEFVGLR